MSVWFLIRSVCFYIRSVCFLIRSVCFYVRSVWFFIVATCAAAGCRGRLPPAGVAAARFDLGVGGGRAALLPVFQRCCRHLPPPRHPETRSYTSSSFSPPLSRSSAAQQPDFNGKSHRFTAASGRVWLHLGELDLLAALLGLHVEPADGPVEGSLVLRF